MALDEIQQLALAVIARHDTELDVGPVETQHQRLDPAGEQPGGDVAARRFVRRRRQGDDRRLGEKIA